MEIGTNELSSRESSSDDLFEYDGDQAVSMQRNMLNLKQLKQLKQKNKLAAYEAKFENKRPMLNSMYLVIDYVMM